MKNFAPRLVGSARIALLGSVAAACLAMPGAALAQMAEEQAQPATGAPPEAEESFGNDIVVTATKREQTLQEVPVAVSVTTAATIERAQIRDIRDLASVVPSLRVSQLQSSANTNFLIRGFGNGANNAGIESSVGLFVDGVYRSRSASMIGDLPDIQRVEVLRGPQSTLFGKNASAGIISFVTQSPQFDFGGNVEASYGNYNAMVFKGVVTGPVSETIAVSLAGGLNKRDGNIRDLVSGVRTGERDRWFLRGQALFEGDSGLKVRLIGDYSNIDEVCCGVVNLVPSVATSLILSPQIGGQVNTSAQRYDGIIYNNFPSTNKIKNYGFSGQIDYEFGPVNLTSISAWRKTDAVTNQDSDFTSGELLNRNFQDLQIETITQELRLATDLDGPFNFLLGAYYFNEKIKQANEVTLGNDFRTYADLQVRGASRGAFNIGLVEQLLGLASTGNPAQFVGRFFQTNTGLNEAYRLKDESYTAFGQVDFEITDGLTLTAGINYTKDKKNYSTDVVSNEVFSGLQLSSLVAPARQVLIAQGVGTVLNTAVPGLVPTGFASAAQVMAVATGGFGAAAQTAYNTLVVPQATAGAAQLGTLTPLQIFPPFLNVPNSVESGRLSDTDLSFTLRLAYDVSDSINVYASFATGYKPGSVNLSRDSRPFPASRTAITNAGLLLNNLTFTSRFADPEDATVYEAGLKANWGLVTANVAVFQQSIKNFQSNIFSGLGFFLTNAGKQSTFGIEFEGTAKPSDELTLSLSATYLDPTYDSFPVSAFGDLTGTRPAGIPAVSATFGAEWDQPIGEDHLILRADFHYESSYVGTEGLPGFLTRNPDGTINAASIPLALAAVRPFAHEVNDLNASITYAMENGLELTLWGRNILNHRYISQTFDSPAQSGSVSGYPNQPRTYGATARFRW